MIQHVNDMIERTHRLTGIPREEVVRRGLIKKEIPMYTIGGGAVMGGLAAAGRVSAPVIVFFQDPGGEVASRRMPAIWRMIILYSALSSSACLRR